MKACVSPMHISFSTCSYKTKIVITHSADNLMGSLFATSNWNGHDLVHKNYSYLSRCFNFVRGCFPYACSDEFVNHSWNQNR